LGTAPQSEEYSETRVPLSVAAPGREICSSPREFPLKRGLKNRSGEGDLVAVASVLRSKMSFGEPDHRTRAAETWASRRNLADSSGGVGQI